MLYSQRAAKWERKPVKAIALSDLVTGDRAVAATLVPPDGLPALAPPAQ